MFKPIIISILAFAAAIAAGFIVGTQITTKPDPTTRVIASLDEASAALDDIAAAIERIDERQTADKAEIDAEIADIIAALEIADPEAAGQAMRAARHAIESAEQERPALVRGHAGGPTF